MSGLRGVRRPGRGAKRIPIFIVLLKKGNVPMTANRIQLILKKEKIFFLESNEHAGIARGIIGKMCKELESNGFLESKMLLGPRRKEKSPHYTLPVEDRLKMLKASRLLIRTCPLLFLASPYSIDVFSRMVIPACEAVLGEKLDKETAEVVMTICSRSPGAFERMLDSNLFERLCRLASIVEPGEKPGLEHLLSYLNSAFMIDLADNRVCWKPGDAAYCG